MRKVLFVFAFLCTITVSAKQKKQDKLTLVEYSTSDKETSNQAKTCLLYQDNLAMIFQQTTDQKLNSGVAKETSFIDFKDSVCIGKAILKENRMIHVSSPLDKYYSFKLTDKYEEILGYRCRKATKVSFSNRVDVWFTTEVKAKGSPLPRYGLTDGLIMRIARNGNTVLVATAIKKLKQKKAPSMDFSHLGELVTSNQYRYLVRENCITRVPIFEDEQVAWKGIKEDCKERTLDRIYRLNSGTLLVKKIKLPKVTNDYMVFIKVIQYSNGDAYDRTGTVFLIPNEKKLSALDTFMGKKEAALPVALDNKGNEMKGITSTENYDCPIELMRFFTPFGIRKYNEKRSIPNVKWRNQAMYKQDITHLLPRLRGEVWIAATVGNYDQGGHKLSVELEYYPTEKQQQDTVMTQYVQPLFNNAAGIPGQGNSDLFAHDSLKCQFSVPENVKNLKMMYLTTGHGGWGGGDEFNQKANTIAVDGKKVFVCVPWRTDCATYRELNPASGTSWNGITSSDYSRSNWAPGTTTNPIVVPLPDLKAGHHTMTVSIPQGPKGCAWNVSGVLIGEYDKKQ